MAMPIETHVTFSSFGVQSVSGGTRNFTRTATRLDTSKYDQATYFWEVVANNSDASDKVLTLLDDAGTTITTINVGHALGTTQTRIRSSAITPTSGNHYYTIQTAQTTSNNQLQCWVARFVIQQNATATKTRISIPLSIGDNTSISNADLSTVTNTDRTASTTFTQQNAIFYPRWNLVKANFATITNYSFESTFRIEGAGQIASVALFINESVQVNSSTLTHTGDTNASNQIVDLTASEILDNDRYSVFMKTNNGAVQAAIFGATFHIDLTNMTLAEVPLLVSRNFTGPNSYVSPDIRPLVNLGGYYNPTAYFQVNGGQTTPSDLGASATVTLTDFTTTDSGTTGSSVSGGTITPPIAQQQLTRSSALTLTSNDRFGVNFAGRSATNLQVNCCWIVITCQGSNNLAIQGIG